MGKSKRREEEELIYQTGTHIIKPWLGQEVNKLSLTHVCPDSQELQEMEGEEKSNNACLRVSGAE